ncbi:MAG: hypothetical protein Q9220_006019 [cf. Caloplaca sp. 1 TL-2023]
MASESETNQPPTRSLGTVVVIGGCGFLGSHIATQLLLSYNCTLHIIDLHEPRPGTRKKNAIYHTGDITSYPSVLSLFQSIKPDVVIHTASPAFTSNNKKLHTGAVAQVIFDRVNFEGTRNLLDCSLEVGTVKAFVYTSSSSVVHNGTAALTNASESSHPILLNYPHEQPEYYSVTKARAENLVLSYNRHTPPSSSSSNDNGSQPTLFLTCALRPAGLFGEGDAQVIPGMMRALENRQTKFQLGDNTNLFDFTYVGNAAHAHILAAIALLKTQNLSSSPSTSSSVAAEDRADGQPFFITNTQPLYFWDFPRAIWSASGDPISLSSPSSIYTINEPLGLFLATLMEWAFWIFTLGTRGPSMTRGIVKYSCMTRYFDTGRAERVLGYKPIWGMEEGVRRSVGWWRECKKAEAVRECGRGHREVGKEKVVVGGFEKVA